MAEFGIQGKACIVVPGTHLTGGHQVKNARRWSEQGVAMVVEESRLSDQQLGLLATVKELLADEGERQRLGKALQAHTIPDAAGRLAKLLLEQAARRKR
jgi:UDP-N-acetylglucosamine:LPS N-acetylglucosamine transferase